MIHREPFRRPLLIFGLLLIGPAAGLTWLGWRSVEHEGRMRRSEAETEARVLLDRVVDEERAALDAIRSREQRRPYYEFSEQYQPADLVSNSAPAYVASPLQQAPEDPRLRGWFQWTLGRRDVIGPDVFGPASGEWKEGFARAFGPSLATKLRTAATYLPLVTSPPVPVPVQTVAANEEMAQLLEEFQVAQSKGEDATERLKNFQSRVQGAPGAPIGVHYTPFSYMVAGGGFPLVAWRLVWIPGRAAKEQRDAPSDRYLLQGYLLEPGRSQSPDWHAVAPNVLLHRGGSWSIEGVLIPGRWLVEPSQLELAAPVATDPSPALLGLQMSAAVNMTEIRDATEAARQRFLLLVGGLGAVVTIGFGVLLRSVRREVEVARKKEDFVAAVTHELKTPLTSIRMYADMLREGWSSDPDSTGDYATKIGSEAQRLDALVDQVLALAAYDHGVASFRPVPGDLGEAVRAAVSMLEPKAAEAGVPVRVEVEEGLPLVPFDAALMRGIVLNLVDNAVKYSARSATKDVSVRVAREGARVALVVSDRGAGIPAKERKRVFDPFYRAGREETRTATGVGIGLALVKRYADAHGARIALDSEEGKGTTVSVSFPA